MTSALEVFFTRTRYINLLLALGIQDPPLVLRITIPRAVSPLSAQFSEGDRLVQRIDSLTLLTRALRCIYTVCQKVPILTIFGVQRDTLAPYP